MSDFKINEYDYWRTEPTQENLRAVVDSLQPSIDGFLRSIGADSDPYLKAEARVLAAGAVQKYSPLHGTQLKTFVSGQLQPLRRTKRESQGAIRLPERVQLDAWALQRAENEFMDQHNREPDLEELSDWAKMPVRRIRKVRQQLRPTASETQLEQAVPGQTVDYSDEAAEYVYRDADYIDRKIMEWKIGYGGSKTLNPSEIATKLKISPAQLSRRSAKLSLKIYDVERMLQK